MARILGRSRSLRMLKGNHKDKDPPQQRETASTTPLPTHSQVENERLKAAAPVSRTSRKVDAPDMSQRPKTSSGPSDRSTLFHRKVTPVQRVEHQDFEFSSTSPTKSTTFLYTAELHESREGIIGIALGSPTMASHWNVSSLGNDFVGHSQGTITRISSNNENPSGFPQAIQSHQEAPKPKLSRWKSLFKKTGTPPPREKESFYQLANSATPARADSHHDDDPMDSRSFAQQEHDPRALSPPIYTYNPQIPQSRRAPKGQAQPAVDTRPRVLTTNLSPTSKPKSSLLRSLSSPKPPPKNGFSKSPTVPRLVVYGSTEVSSPASMSERPILDVAIPDVHMERYSVMFSGLLQQNTTSSSSLLQRRQGHTDKLKPLTELSKKNTAGSSQYGSLKPQRRATSPSFAPKSPSAHLSLFPTASSSRAPSPRSVSVDRPRPLERSRTAPASSPHRQSFPKQAEDGANTSFQEYGFETRGLPTPSPSQLATPSSERSFDSESEEITIAVARNGPPQSWNPRLEEQEPEWEIVTKPSQTAAVTRASALSSHPMTTGIHPSSAPLELPTSARSERAGLSRSQTLLSPGPRSAGRAASDRGSLAMVGVARSVSVSRATKPEFLKSANGAGRFVDSKPLTPTLVELRNRKSQRVQLVDA